MDKKQAGRGAAATGWLVKPFNPEQLLGTIRKVLGWPLLYLGSKKR
jgi:two-component system chemotaxis response regulator CheY